MFAAAMLYAAPNTEISIYSTCKRISQKLLRNVIKFLELIYVGLNVPRFRVIRENMEELVIRGPESMQDVRIVNSYPSKVLFNRRYSTPTPPPAPAAAQSPASNMSAMRTLSVTHLGSSTIRCAHVSTASVDRYAVMTPRRPPCSALNESAVNRARLNACSRSAGSLNASLTTHVMRAWPLRVSRPCTRVVGLQFSRRNVRSLSIDTKGGWISSALSLRCRSKNSRSPLVADGMLWMG